MHSFSLFLLSVLAPFCFLLGLPYLLAVHYRKRLPFYEAEIVDTRLEPLGSCSWLSRLAVFLQWSPPEGRIRRSMFAVVLGGSPEKARAGARYARMNEYYCVGKTLRMYHVPNADLLCGVIPESPGLPPGSILMAVMILLCGVASAVMTCRGVGPFA